MTKNIWKYFIKSRKKTFGMNEVGSAGLIATLANNIAMFNMIGDMNEKSKILNIAFAVSASFTFGDHLAFCSRS